MKEKKINYRDFLFAVERFLTIKVLEQAKDCRTEQECEKIQSALMEDEIYNAMVASCGKLHTARMEIWKQIINRLFPDIEPSMFLQATEGLVPILEKAVETEKIYVSFDKEDFVNKIDGILEEYFTAEEEEMGRIALKSSIAEELVHSGAYFKEDVIIFPFNGKIEVVVELPLPDSGGFTPALDSDIPDIPAAEKNSDFDVNP